MVSQIEAKEMREANEVRSKLLDREEKLQAQSLLGGNSSGGKTGEKPPEETPAKYSARVMAGNPV
ncbi:MAG: hypothetical protein IIA49_13830 [Bacteroidetes bacterium]|nr:hypothetical protein [Bacteroidota bacterium]